jgi:hypothetical protein
MDFNLRTAPGGKAAVTNLDFREPYGDVFTLRKVPFEKDSPPPIGTSRIAYFASGTYLSPPHDWGLPVRLVDLCVAADLNAGQVTATVEVSDDGFRTIASTTQVRVLEGVNTYSLDSLRVPARAVRVRIGLKRGADPARSPVVDGFRITGQPVQTR